MADFPPVGNPQILSQQFPNYSQVTTQAPGSGFTPGGMGMPGGFDMSAMAKFAQQMAAYKAAQAAKQQAYARQQAEREFRFRQQQAEAQAGQENSKMAFAREQWQALQDDKNKMVPIYRPLTTGGPGYTGGYGAPSTFQGPGSVAAGYIPAWQAELYSQPGRMTAMPAMSGGALSPDQPQPQEIQQPAAAQQQALKSDPFAEYDAYWEQVRAREAQQQPLMTPSLDSEPDFSDVLGGAS